MLQLFTVQKTFFAGFAVNSPFPRFLARLMHTLPVCFSAHMWSIVLCLQYEPELFPGLIYRMKVPKIVLLIFVSGKVVLTGRLRCMAAETSFTCTCM